MARVEGELARLVKAVRRSGFGDAEEAEAIERVLVRDESEKRVLRHSRAETRTLIAVIDAVAQDERFEHLRDAKSAVLEFIGYSLAVESDRPVGRFVDQHAKEPEERICYVPIEHLEVDGELNVLGLRLLPRGNESVPDSDACRGNRLLRGGSRDRHQSGQGGRPRASPR